MQTHRQLLPTAEIGTAQQEIPVTTTTYCNPEDTDGCMPSEDNTWDPDSREEVGERTFQQIRLLMEDGRSQTLTHKHAEEIVIMATRMLLD